MLSLYSSIITKSANLPISGIPSFCPSSPMDSSFWILSECNRKRDLPRPLHRIALESPASGECRAGFYFFILAPIVIRLGRMTFRDQVESHPVGWLVGVGAASFVTGVFLTLGFMQVIIADRGPRDTRIGGKSVAEPTRAMSNLVTRATPASVIPEKLGDNGNLDMTIQQFGRAYAALDGRYSEQEAFIKRADRKRVRWRVVFARPATFGDDVTVYFDVPKDSADVSPPERPPVGWATFPISFHDRLYALKRGDLIEITGVLHMRNPYELEFRADDFDLVSVFSPTPTSPAQR